MLNSRANTVRSVESLGKACIVTVGSTGIPRFCARARKELFAASVQPQKETIKVAANTSSTNAANRLLFLNCLNMPMPTAS